MYEAELELYSFVAKTTGMQSIILSNPAIQGKCLQRPEVCQDAKLLMCSCLQCYNLPTFWVSMADAFYQSLICFFIPYLVSHILSS
jgi:hypothetical protein